jgi:hypothetical protein
MTDVSRISATILHKSIKFEYTVQPPDNTSIPTQPILSVYYVSPKLKKGEKVSFLDDDSADV